MVRIFPAPPTFANRSLRSRLRLASHPVCLSDICRRSANLRSRVAFILLSLPLIAGCGSNPAAPGEPAATITIGAAGVSPKEVRLSGWGFVRFVNADTKPHAMLSDPIDLHTQCPPLNRVGLLQPGESRDSGTLTTGTCNFHDHDDRSEAFRGRIVVE